MKKQSSFIDINKKLESLAVFLKCEGVVIESEDRLYAYPEQLDDLFLEKPGSERSIIFSELRDTYPHHQRFRLKNGSLTIINPAQPADESVVTLFGEELLEETQLDAIFNTILEANMAISSDLNLNTVLHIIMSLVEDMIGPEVTAVMLLSPDKKELYWEVSRGEGSHFFTETVRLPVGVGLGGYVAQTGETVISNDVSQDHRWDRTKDIGSGFTTRSMICVPLKFHGEILGVIEVINKREGPFTTKDLRIIEIIAAQSASAIENAKIYGALEEAYEELKVINLTREKIINHLSHELRTPLAVISSVLSQLEKEAQHGRFEKAIKRSQRNLKRLQDIEAKVADIMNNRPVQEGQSMLSLVEDTLSLSEELEEGGLDQARRFILEQFSEKLKSILPVEETQAETIRLDEFLKEIRDQAVAAMGERELEMDQDWGNGLALSFSRSVLTKISSGLLKNAIENTPDEGRIEIKVGSGKNAIKIEFVDFGMGITPLNQKMIFAGFFHTQETGAYSSKRPYEFNAGGAGADLLRLKVFSERYGFTLEFRSERCRFIPQNQDICPGRISKCPFIKDRSECLGSGRTSFGILIPGPA